MVEKIQSVGDGKVSVGACQSEHPATSAGLCAPALPLRAGQLQIHDLVDLYFAHYSGRDATLVQRLTWWRGRIGPLTLEELSDDQVHAGLEALSTQTSRYFAGKDADGKAIYKAKKKPLTPATINRYLAALGALISWAIKKRIAPKGFVHPCRTVERRAENNERVRFLSDEERQSLLKACAGSKWPRLLLLVLMALTTGARKSELLSLCWEDIDFERKLAYCGRTKNGDPRALPLVPDVHRLLMQFREAPNSLVFASQRQPSKAFGYESCWRAALAKAKIRHFRFHDLRHSCASMLAQNGATLLEIADVLGHRQLQMTKRYSHLTTGHKEALVNRIWSGMHDGKT